MKHTGVKQALEYVTSHPEPETDAYIELYGWELVARRLVHIANNVDLNTRMGMRKASQAQKMVLDRMVGKRRPGTHPAARGSEAIEFVDLTAGIAAKEAEDAVED